MQIVELVGVMGASIHCSFEHAKNSNFELVVSQNFLNSGIFGLKFLLYNDGNFSPINQSALEN
jgi:hypothetical protein